MDRLAQAVGLPVEYQTFDTVTDQLLAMRHGKLHVTAFNTGSVPRAVNQCGFVPVSAKANPEGDWKIAMKVIVPVKSTVNQVSDLRGQYITFTNPASFSGFRLAIVTLQKEFGMLPGNDYDYRFSTSHNHSIRSVADGELEAACVASDMLSDASAGGTLDEASIREIYTSTAFPAAAFGYVYNLDSDLAAKIGEFLRTASLDATPLDPSGDGSAANTLVATQYKEDWKSVREVDDATGWRHELPKRGIEKGVGSASSTEVSVPESGDSSPVTNTVPEEGESVETAG
ncbi:MAG TPA: PhnD/SsuA/transferrin family substrate-binding protein, partial [Pirellulaceae bacterium]